MRAMLQEFEPVDRRQTLTDQIAAVLRERVLSGDLVAGGRLPSEQQLAEAFEVSRTVVREAIARLRVDGLITTKQGVGAFVSHGKGMPRLDAGQIDASKRTAFVFEVRWVMEPGIVGLAARRRTIEQVHAIEATVVAFEKSVQTGHGSVDADVSFHKAIAEAAGNPLFDSLVAFTQEMLREALQASHRSMMNVKGSLARVQREHNAIYRAIRDRDEAAARRAAVNHLTHAASRMSFTLG